MLGRLPVVPIANYRCVERTRTSRNLAKADLPVACLIASFAHFQLLMKAVYVSMICCFVNCKLIEKMMIIIGRQLAMKEANLGWPIIVFSCYTHRLEQQVADLLLCVPLCASAVEMLEKLLVLTKNLRNLEEYFVHDARVHDISVLFFQWLYVFLWNVSVSER